MELERLGELGNLAVTKDLRKFHFKLNFNYTGKIKNF